MIRGILAGIMIGVGGIAYASCDNKYAGALLFTVGLVTILVFGFYLYTGQVCYCIEGGVKQIKKTLISLIGNAIGCVAVGLLMPLEKCVQICDSKLLTPLPSVFLKAVFCGILIYIAVHAYKTAKSLLLVFLCIPAFILCGFEHSIADIFYFSSAYAWNLDSLVFILVVIVGNAVGGLLFPFAQLFIKDKPPVSDSETK